jgi:phosphate-selective porin OprO/OprP
MNIGIRKKALLGVALGALVAMQGAAQASETSAEIRLLKARLKQLEERVSEQGRKEKEIQKQIRHAAGAPPMVCKDGPCPPPPPPVFVTFGNGLKVESFDHDFSFKIGGRVFVDGGFSSQPELGKSGNAGLRRARLEVEGKAFKYWLYKFQYDFTSSGAAGIRDAYLALKYPGLAIVPFTTQPVILQVGHFYEPNGLEALTSSKYIDFIERSAPTDVFNPFRHIGVAAGVHGTNWSAKTGIFTTSPEDTSSGPLAGIPAFPYPSYAVSTGGRQYYDISGRVTYAPIMEKDALIHLGGSARFQEPNDATGGTESKVMFLGSNVRSEANILTENLVGTIDLSCGAVFTGSRAVAGKCVNNIVNYGAEFVASYGPFSVQAEYMGSHYNRNSSALAFAATNAAASGNNQFARGGSSLDFNGYYVYGTWYLTGESRAASYNVGALNSAEFGQIKILQPFSKGGVGAWEVAARFSEINLNSGGILGGREQDLTVGLNWYPDKGIRFMANWVRVMNLVAPAQNVTTTGNVYNRPYLNGAHPNLFVVRAQVDW